MDEEILKNIVILNDDNYKSEEITSDLWREIFDTKDKQKRVEKTINLWKNIVKKNFVIQFYS